MNEEWCSAGCGLYARTEASLHQCVVPILKADDELVPRKNFCGDFARIISHANATFAVVEIVTRGCRHAFGSFFTEASDGVALEEPFHFADRIGNRGAA